MRIKCFLIVLTVLLVGAGLGAKDPSIFLNDGTQFNSSIVDMSSRNREIEFGNQRKVAKTQVWMINFMDNNWNFPAERNQLASGMDTLFMNDGGLKPGTITDFTTRRGRGRFQLANGEYVEVSGIKRIYFCCSPLPQYYRDQINGDQTEAFPLNSNVLESPMEYLDVSGQWGTKSGTYPVEAGKTGIISIPAATHIKIENGITTGKVGIELVNITANPPIGIKSRNIFPEEEFSFNYEMPSPIRMQLRITNLETTTITIKFTVTYKTGD